VRSQNRFRDGFCRGTGKKRWRDHGEAVRALHQAANARRDVDRRGGGASTDHREVRTYRCGSCGGWHLTSQQSRAPLIGDSLPTDAEIDPPRPQARRPGGSSLEGWKASAPMGMGQLPGAASKASLRSVHQALVAIRSPRPTTKRS